MNTAVIKECGLRFRSPARNWAAGTRSLRLILICLRGLLILPSEDAVKWQILPIECPDLEADFSCFSMKELDIEELW